MWPSERSRLRLAVGPAEAAAAITRGERLRGRGPGVELVEHEREQHLGVAGALDADGPRLGDRRGAAPRRPGRGSRATKPLSENSHGPAANGALPVSTIGDGGVALRTAASDGAGVHHLGDRAEGAVGPHRRRRAVAGRLGPHGGSHQPTPQPSAFMAPSRWCSGFQLCRSSDCAGS